MHARMYTRQLVYACARLYDACMRANLHTCVYCIELRRLALPTLVLPGLVLSFIDAELHGFSTVLLYACVLNLALRTFPKWSRPPPRASHIQITR